MEEKLDLEGRKLIPGLIDAHVHTIGGGGESGFSTRVPAVELLLGGGPENETELARLASPIFHVDRSDPPLLLIHGDQDPQVPINQSHELHGAYKQHNLTVHFEVVHGGAHGGDAFFDARRNELVRKFFEQHLVSRPD